MLLLDDSRKRANSCCDTSAERSHLRLKAEADVDRLWPGAFAHSGAATGSGYREIWIRIRTPVALWPWEADLSSQACVVPLEAREACRTVGRVETRAHRC